MRVCLYLPDGRRLVGDITGWHEHNPPPGIVWGEINLEFYILNGMGVYIYKHTDVVLTPTHHLSDDELATFEDYGNG